MWFKKAETRQYEDALIERVRAELQKPLLWKREELAKEEHPHSSGNSSWGWRHAKANVFIKDSRASNDRGDIFIIGNPGQVQPDKSQRKTLIKALEALRSLQVLAAFEAADEEESQELNLVATDNLVKSNIPGVYPASCNGCRANYGSPHYDGCDELDT